MLDSLVITDVGFNITPSNATNLYAINGMLNPLANAIVKGLEQTTVVSVYNIRSHAAVTNNYVPTNGITGDFLGAAVQAGNIALNKYVLGPIGDLFGVNARVALTGESKQVRDFFEDIVAERGQEGGLIALHSRANQETMLALQSVDEGFFPKNPITGESHYLFMSNGSPVNGSVLSSAIHNAAGALIALVCKSTDQICQGVGGNTGTYIAQPNGGSYSPALTSSLESYLEPMVGSNSQISNLLDFKQWQQLGAEKYPIYEADDGDLTYLSQPSYEQINKTSAHSMYGCLVGDLCGGAFGGPATKRPPPQEKRK